MHQWQRQLWFMENAYTCCMSEISMTEIRTRLAAVERLQCWTLGLISGLILALLTGAFAVIAALLQ